MRECPTYLDSNGNVIYYVLEGNVYQAYQAASPVDIKRPSLSFEIENKKEAKKV